MGVLGNILHDACDAHVVLVTDPHHLSHGILVPEMTPCDLLRQHHSIGLLERRCCITFDQTDVENAEYCRLCPKHACFHDRLSVYADKSGAGTRELDGRFHLRKILFHCLSQRSRNDGKIVRAEENVPGILFVHAVNAVSLLMERIIAQLVLHIHQNKCAAGESDGQTGHIQRSRTFVPKEMTESRFEIVEEHGYPRIGQRSWCMEEDAF